jgi:hypothetical protein
MSPKEQERFDALVEEAVGELPEGIRALLDEVPVIVMDRPTAEILKSLGAEGEDPLEVILSVVLDFDAPSFVIVLEGHVRSKMVLKPVLETLDGGGHPCDALG